MANDDITQEREQTAKELTELLAPCLTAVPTEGALVIVSTPGNNYHIVALNVGPGEAILMLHRALNTLSANEGAHDMPEMMQ